jgi:HEAT repeat protein
MRCYSARSLNNIFTVVVLTSFISFSFCSICFSQDKNVNSPERLIQELKDENPIVRSKAAEALGDIKDSRAVEPLIAALKDKNKDVRFSSAGALGKIKDPRAIKPLIASLKDENLEIIAGAYTFFIKRGDSGSESLLIKALDRYGYSAMATDFLNCGNSALAEAAKKWAKKNDLQIYPSGFHISGPVWGR